MNPADDIRARLKALPHRLEQVLPAQAPIKDFVHHNTLHGLQHLEFSQAVRAARQRTGANAYLPIERYREFYAQNRIDADDLADALRQQVGDEVAQILPGWPDGPHAGAVYRTALLHPLPALSRSQLKWQVEEMGALDRLQDDVGAEARGRLLGAGADEAAVARDLWAACLDVLGLEHALLHPEELLDPSSAQIDALLEHLRRETGLTAETPGQTELANRILRREAAALQDGLFARLGGDWTLRRLLLALTGEDLFDDLRPLLARHLGAYLDQGLVAWHNPARPAGFYAAWRASAEADPAWLFQDMPEWRQFLERLPDDPLDVLVAELRLLGLAESQWCDYLERLCLELPGWSGMALWRAEHRGYADAAGVELDMLDYLAVLLVLERLFAQRICRRHWRIEASLPGLRWHFHHQPAELLVRAALFEGRLPEYLVSFAEALVGAAVQEGGLIHDDAWQTVAQLIWSWRQTPAADRRGGRGVADTAWPLFRLAQLLGLSGAELRAAGAEGAEALLAASQRFDTDALGHLWLLAYEGHFRQQVFAALAANHGRGAWATRTRTPAAQLVFCMDDREEGFRRHLEAVAPALETFGAAAHFNVFHNWYGLDEARPTVLCPVVARPAHNVREVARPAGETWLARHRARLGGRLRRRDRLAQQTRLGLLSGPLLTVLAAPYALFALIARVLAPAASARLGLALNEAHEKRIPTRLRYVAAPDSPPASEVAPREGFDDVEQADRVQAFLRNIGLTDGFAPLLVIVGHGSNSRNNPHLAAYDCGACSGRHSGPNARLLAAMANRAEVRALLAGRGLTIPVTTHVIGCEHNTCDDGIIFLDREDVPAALGDALAELERQLAVAGAAHAQERCRRLASAPLSLSAAAAWRHVGNRRWDDAQARPELGHATNAWALVGRRSVTRGAFFDRRAFLISYDPTRDADGSVLEGLLLANGPVGAGINLEYYFSTVDNERYGCGTKTMHNVVGFFGVMEGTGSDLRTGLPQQMIEIHEAMRLLVVVEQKTELLSAIYQRQAPLRELIGNGWLLLAAKDPDSAALHFFDPARGWLAWQDPGLGVARAPDSRDWFRGCREALPPALLETGAEA